jgi:5'-nucleotidase
MPMSSTRFRRRLSGVLFTLLLSVPLAAQERPHILVTNDDGIQSTGIAAIAEELRTFADVVVVAPAENSSGGSHSTVIRGIRTELTPFVRNGQTIGYGINATPADAAKFGILHFGAQRKFDMVVSGINAGANTGDVAHYSGTIGAAMEAIFHGIPAIATSQDARQDYKYTARLTARIVREALEKKLPPGVILTINVPGGEPKGIKATPMRGTYFGVGGFREIAKDGNTELYRATMRGADRRGDDSDTAAYLDGYVTVTPLRFDWTDPAMLDALGQWNLSLK